MSNTPVNDGLDVIPFVTACMTRVLYSLATYANKAGYCFPAARTIARDAGISVSYARLTIRRLVALGIVTKRQRLDKSNRQTSNGYTIDLHLCGIIFRQTIETEYAKMWSKTKLKPTCNPSVQVKSLIASAIQEDPKESPQRNKKTIREGREGQGAALLPLKVPTEPPTAKGQPRRKILRYTLIRRFLRFGDWILDLPSPSGHRMGMAYPGTLPDVNRTGGTGRDPPYDWTGWDWGWAGFSWHPIEHRMD